MSHKKLDRRTFLQAGLSLFPLSVLASNFDYFKKQPLLSFSTLGCPDWEFDHILDFAVKNGYQGIEIRGIKRQVDLFQCPEFASTAAIASTRRKFKDHKLSIVDLGSSVALHHTGQAERQKNLDDGKRYIDLAHALGCPFVRVFPNNLPKDNTREAVMQLIISGLQQLGDYAKSSGVTVLMESHGEVVWAADILRIMEAAENPRVGLVWDITNMWTVTKEPPATVYTQLKKYIHHTHIKDAKLDGGKLKYVLLGQGDTPIFDAIDILRKDGYKGYYSFEWEKLWHPDIAEPEIALADYPIAMKKHFSKKI